MPEIRPKTIKGGNGIPDDYCVAVKDFVSTEECEEANKKKKQKQDGDGLSIDE